MDEAPSQLFDTFTDVIVTILTSLASAAWKYNLQVQPLVCHQASPIISENILITSHKWQYFREVTGDLQSDTEPYASLCEKTNKVLKETIKYNVFMESCTWYGVTLVIVALWGHIIQGRSFRGKKVLKKENVCVV